MKTCPVCKTTQLTQIFLETGLPAHECRQCGGIWITANEYARWSEDQPADFSQPLPQLPLSTEDSKKAALCPDCGRILRRFRIQPGVEFHLDRCSNCNGIWFDQLEWQILKLHELHAQINRFFTEPWQRDLRSEETRQRFEQMYQEKFGTQDYERIKEIRLWLETHPQGPALLAYLTDKMPYGHIIEYN